MVLALSQAAKVDIGLIGVFFVLFPVLVHGLLGLAGGRAYAEKQENDEYRRTNRIPGTEI